MDDINPSIRLIGMRLRDEFICPITYEILIDPVVIMDGHTYEKKAIDKWFANNGREGHRISPLSGEVLKSDITIPNHNLRHLIQDIIHEGGMGLYGLDASSLLRTIEIKRQKILTLTCLGPDESEWNSKQFLVRPSGVIGGRGNLVDAVMKGKEIIPFTDLEVSRRHFEIVLLPDYYDSKGYQEYGIKDLGSVGGTFMRLPIGTTLELNPDVIFLLGQHQFLVTSIEDDFNEYDVNQEDNKLIRNQIDESTQKLSDIRLIDNELDLKQNEIDPTSNNQSIHDNHKNKVLKITCSDPVGSLIRGKSYVIRSEGGTMGRKLTNTIAIYGELKNPDGSITVLTIDSPISSEHATIYLDNKTGKFHLKDGVNGRLSTKYGGD